MKKRAINITFFMGWLIGLMFFAHGITPHQHHFDSFYEHSQQTDQDEDIPSHCHAFNVLVFDRTGVTNSHSSVFKDFTALIFNNNLKLSIPENTFGIINTVYQDKRPDEEVFLKNSPTRGSPVVI